LESTAVEPEAERRGIIKVLLKTVKVARGLVAVKLASPIDISL
jgi:hypothetical protein